MLGEWRLLVVGPSGLGRGAASGDGMINGEDPRLGGKLWMPEGKLWRLDSSGISSSGEGGSNSLLRSGVGERLLTRMVLGPSSSGALVLAMNLLCGSRAGNVRLPGAICLLCYVCLWCLSLCTLFF